MAFVLAGAEAADELGERATTLQAAPLAERHALVTGGGSGIGVATAAALTAAGARVTILGRQESKLRDAVAAGQAASYLIADVNDESATITAIAQAGTSLGPILLLVNVAGAITATQAALPAMLAAGFGCVIIIASTASLKGYRYVSAYVAAKHPLLGVTRALAQEVAGSGVTARAGAS